MNLATKMIKRCWMPLAILIIIMAILFSTFRALTPWATQYKGKVEHHLSALIGQPVVINSMETSWYWFEPVLRLNHVTVSDNDEHVITFNKLLVGINLFSSIWHWHIQPGILYADDVHLTLRQEDHHWQIEGLQKNKKVTLEQDLYLPVLSWVLGQQKIIMKHVFANVYLKNGTLLPISDLNLTAVNNNGHYRLKGNAKLEQSMATELQILADMQLNRYALREVSGRAYFSVNQLLLEQWQEFVPNSQYRLEGGRGNLKAWLDMSKGHISGLQSTFDLHRLSLRKNGDTKPQCIKSLRANLAWKPTRGGWQLSGDHMQLRANGVRWPENAFVVSHDTLQQTYRVFAKNLLIEPILAADVTWPELMQPVLALHPLGQLEDTQIEVKEGKINSVLTRFRDLSWQSQQKIPAVRHLSGVLSWQPTEGRLELDSENTSITSKGYPAVTFAAVNAAFEWKELSHGLRISMDRLILSRQDLVLSAQGAIDEPFTPSARQLRLTAEFSAENAHQWLPYVPSRFVKHKLDDWLKQDIKRINKASGQLTINGALADFPFDNKPGEFSIVSRLSGVDLYFNKLWPLNRDIDAYLRIDKRNMNVEVLQAEMMGVKVDAVNFHIDALGLDKETMILHGKIDAPAQKALDYVFASPLKTHLAKLQSLDIDGPIGLDLRLEVPLYPENNEVLARGEVTFDKNQVTIHHVLNNLQLRDFSGVLQFDEHGVTDSSLRASLLDEPVAIRIQSKNEPKPHSEVTIEGNTTVNALREKFDMPALPFLQGQLKVEGQLMLTNEPNDSDHFRVSTSLQGVAIDLPVPFGKSADETAPLQIDVDVNQQKSLRLRFNYDGRLSGDLWFADNNQSLILDKGQVRIGSGEALWQKNPGIQVVGALSAVDVKRWSDLYATLDLGTPSASMLDKISSVDMKLGNVVLWGQSYPKVAVTVNKLAKEEWAIKLDQRDITADLEYQSSTNTLSGRIERLYLSKSSWTTKSTYTTTSRFTPIDIPNLDITIDDFTFDQVDVGNVVLKSVSTAHRWHLDSCKITSPDYRITIKGDWLMNDKINKTEIQADLQSADLGKSLKRWHIMPAVEAHKANIQFNGGWPGTIKDFSLSKVSGQMYMMLQNGRITHLSPETENKLGLGKLLSILSLQTIPRRLKLDFSDLANDGYSYDVFKGNFVLKNGVMNTTDSYIDGPVAYASMKGDLDLVKQLYDLELLVSPHITASLPVVATIAGGPIAGIATWVASKIINQGMQKVTGYTYKVSGPWLDPVVQQVSILKHR